MFDAIVLAGGSGRRLGGVDKPAIEVGGASMLDRVIGAAHGAERIVVVGPERATAAAVHWTREQPPGGGPCAAVAAGLELVESDWCLVLAADLPGIEPAVPVLLTSAADADVAVLVTAGRRNHLAAAWRTEALRAAVARLDTVDGAAARSLYTDVTAVEVEDADGWGRDCDTWDDIEHARRQESP